MIKINENGKVDARELYAFIEVKTRFSDWIKRSIDYADLIEEKDFCSTLSVGNQGGRPKENYQLTIKASIMICLMNFSSSKKSLLLYKHLSELNGSEVIIEYRTRKELLFEIALNDILAGIVKVIPQYSVLKYKVDFYLPEINVAIEYDETHHGYNYKVDKKREQEIIKKIGCCFIRVDENDEYAAINKIIIKILSRK